jgi:uncharacterized protein (DUF2336 family)
MNATRWEIDPLRRARVEGLGFPIVNIKDLTFYSAQYIILALTMSVQPSLIHELENVVAHGSTQRRTAMLWQITDLFTDGSQRFSEDEIDLFDAVITRLAVEIEVSVRALLAQRLAPLAKAPPNITRILARDDDIRVAGPVLTQSDRLDGADLLATAQSQSQAHLLAIAKRRSLSEELTDALIGRGDREVVLNVAQNVGAKFSQNGYCLLVKRSQGDDVLATSIGLRPDIPQEIFLELLATASTVVRAKLTAEHPQLKTEINSAVTAVTDDFRKAVTLKRSGDYAAAKSLVQSLSASGELNDATVRSLAENAKIEEIVVAVAQLCDVPDGIVEQAFIENQTETFLIFAKAAGLSWLTVRAILTLHDKHQGTSSLRTDKSMASFDRLNFNTARRIIDFYRTRGLGLTSLRSAGGTQPSFRSPPPRAH